MNEIIADENDINDELFWNYFKCHNPSLLVKELIRAKLSKNEQLVNNINDELTDFRNAITKKEITESENPNIILDIVENISDFNKQQKDKGRPCMLASRPSDLARIVRGAKVA